VSFAEAAARLAGIAGAYFGWAPALFWQATPAELGAVMLAVIGDGPAPPPTRDELTQMMEAFPDG